MTDFTATEALRRDQSALMAELEAAGAEFKGLACRCPFHDDRNPSAGVFEATDGVWRFKCNGGTCGITGDILEIRAMRTGKDRRALIADVEGPMPETPNAAPARPPVATKPPPKIYADMEAAFADYASWTNPYRPWWEYHNADGSTNSWTMRHDPRDGSRKKFAQFTPHGAGTIIAQGPDSPFPLYHLPDVIAADVVIICEGEKAADAIRGKTGIVATTVLGGAGPGKAKNTDYAPLSSKTLFMWPDNDEAGRGLMADIEKLLWELPTPPLELHLIEPAGMGLKEKGDAADLLANESGDDPAELAAYLWQLIAMNSSPRDQLQFLDDHLARIRTGKFRAIPFPFQRISDSTNALLPGTMTVFVGSAGSTKSFLMFFCLIHWARRGIPCALLAVEDALEIHTMRILALLEGDNRLAISQWCEENDDQVQRARRKHGRELAHLVKCVLAAEDQGRKKRMTLADAMKWIEERAKAGCRIIIVDPVTLLAKGGNPWDADPEFIDRVKAVANEYGCSVIMVTHPSKGKAGAEVFPSMGDIAGGAAWEQAGHTFLWFSACYPDATSMCVERRGDMPMPMTHNRILYQLKARNGIVGGGPRYAIHFDPKTLQFSELGIIEPPIKKKGASR